MGFRTLVKKFIPKKLFKRIEPTGHLLEAMLFNVLNGFPGRGMKVIGVTGTNGKTTTSFLIHRMLQHSGHKTGLMTTVAYGAGEEIHPQIHHMTSVPIPEFMKRLKFMRKQGVEWLVLESTSQALAQHRTFGVRYSLAVLTNLTHEHLDWHGSFENYRNSKRILFKRTNRYTQGFQTGIINADDPNAEYFAQDVTYPILYGEKKGDLLATQVKLSPTGSHYVAEIGDDEYHITCHLPGSFNVYNSLAAVAAGRVVGLTKRQIEEGIAALDNVEGRMTTIDEGQDFEVIVDYAHSPDSFEKLFKDLQPVVQGRLIVLFGSAGRRDEAKRAIQGKLAGEYADEVIVAEEDDRDADGQEIMDQIAGGAESAGKVRDRDLFLVHDRTQAIEFAVSRAHPGDTVLLLGKGHEKTIERADGEHPWDEIGIARIAIKKRRTANR